MKTFNQICNYYGLNPLSNEAKAQYFRHVQQIVTDDREIELDKQIETRPICSDIIHTTNTVPSCENIYRHL